MYEYVSQKNRNSVICNVVDTQGVGATARRRLWQCAMARQEAKEVQSVGEREGRIRYGC